MPTDRRFYILRRGDPWSVRGRKTSAYVCDYPAYLYDQNLIDSICFAQDEEEVKSLINSAFDRLKG